MKLYKLIRSTAALLFVLLLSMNVIPGTVSNAYQNDYVLHICQSSVLKCYSKGSNLKELSATFENEYRYFGDVNNDRKIDLQDVVMIQRFIARLKKLYGNDIIAADLDNNGSIDMNDVVLFQKYIADLTDHFPVGVLFHVI